MDFSNIAKQTRKILKPKYCGAVIVAAGTASRMGGIDKVMAHINGEPMIVHSVRAFQKSDVVDEIVIVTRQDLVTPIMNLCQEFDKVQVVTVGGSSRPESVAIGLNSLSGKVKLAAIHDGARPLITDAVIDRTVRAANSCGAAAPAVPVKDTIKSVTGDIVKETPDRSLLRAVQTPQVFDADFLRVALAKAADEDAPITDDCSAVERMGMSVRLVEGDERNIKVTTPLDLKLAELFLEEMG